MRIKCEINVHRRPRFSWSARPPAVHFRVRGSCCGLGFFPRGQAPVGQNFPRQNMKIFQLSPPQKNQLGIGGGVVFRSGSGRLVLAVLLVLVSGFASSRRRPSASAVFFGAVLLVGWFRVSARSAGAGAGGLAVLVSRFGNKLYILLTFSFFCNFCSQKLHFWVIFGDFIGCFCLFWVVLVRFWLFFVVSFRCCFPLFFWWFRWFLVLFFAVFLFCFG